MSSKFCPICNRIVTVAGKEPPKYCAWGCGSLANEPILPEFKTWAEREKILQDIIYWDEPQKQLTLF